VRFFRRIRKLFKDDKNQEKQFEKTDCTIPAQYESLLLTKKQQTRAGQQVGPPRQLKKLIVNIGLDFGTSYSKVCFEGNHKFYFVELDDTKYIPSVVYYDYLQKKLYFKMPEGTRNIEKIEYFKYSMIDESLPRGNYISTANVREKPEVLCSMFYLACLIKETKAYIIRHYANKFTIKWNINMGVPIDNYDDQNKSLYDKILRLAIKLSDCNTITENNCPLEFLDGFFHENRNISIPRFKESLFNPLPELYAECLYFLQDRNVLDGVYAVVDVGGGTVDMAVIHKESSNTFSIVSKDIQPLGIEILAHNISINTGAYNNIKKALQDNNFERSIELNKEKEREFAKSMSEMFARLAMDVKNKQWPRKALIKQKGNLPVILCGGGAKYKWYEDCIRDTRGRLRPCLKNVGYTLDIMSAEKLIGTSRVENHRLIIARCLAQRIDDIPEISGFPWHFEYQSLQKTNRGVDLEERVIEIYGEIL
jgi:hypothetical protein